MKTINLTSEHIRLLASGSSIEIRATSIAFIRPGDSFEIAGPERDEEEIRIPQQQQPFDREAVGSIAERAGCIKAQTPLV